MSGSISHTETTSNRRVAGYIFLIVSTAVIGFLYGVRDRGILACQPSADSNRYIGICNATNYGDYDHGAFWFGLEPVAIGAVKRASVLFVGNSRMQFGMSSKALDSWFAVRDLDYYLLGFSHTENAKFLEPLMQKLELNPRLLIVNVDEFFDNRLTGPANTVMNKNDALNRYHQKRFWQTIHSRLCGSMAWLCGNSSSYLRNKEDGSWTFSGKDLLTRAAHIDQSISYSDDISESLLSVYVRNATEFFNNVKVDRRCIVLTILPNPDTRIEEAKLLAHQLKLPLIAPAVSGLKTFDGSHLNSQSAETWSDKFVNSLEPYTQICTKA